MINIMIADDHAIVREGLKQIIKDHPDISVAFEARSGREAISRARDDNFDVVLLDISLPDISGLEVLKEINAFRPDMPVLILSVHPEDQYAVRVLKAGAAGYINKTSDPEVMVEAIRKASRGRKYISPSLAEKLALGLGIDQDKLPHENLSDREYEVMILIAGGKSISDIAESLSLSPKTISTYRSRLLKKLNLKTNSDLTYYAIKNKLME